MTAQTPDLAEAIADVIVEAVNTALAGVKAPGRAQRSDAAYYAERVLELAALSSTPEPTLQDRVAPWMQECFGPEIAADKLERGDRLLEEVFELFQSGDYPPERIVALRDYVWSRAIGEPAQEAGGVMVTLAAYCLAHGLDMHEAGEVELARISQPEIMLKIRAKQAAKPTGSALPIAVAPPAVHVPEGYRLVPVEALVERATQQEITKAAYAWRNTKDRETDSGDQAYFTMAWRSLPGLRAFVEAEVQRTFPAAPSVPVGGWRDMADMPDDDKPFWVLERDGLYVTVRREPSPHGGTYVIPGWTDDIHKATKWPTRRYAELDRKSLEHPFWMADAVEHAYIVAAPPPEGTT